MVERRFIRVTEGQQGHKPIVRKIEVCAECGENAPMHGDNPDRVCKDCYDGLLGNWVVANTSV